jgi:N-acetylglucosaminyl-diphospho-decaprenol L-rhamnosyltransferase
VSAELAVVIFTRDDAEHLRACLGALVASPPSCAFEVIVFDNASQDDTAAVVDSFAGALSARRLASATDTSFSAGNNAGWRASDAPLVLFLNPDTVTNGAAIDACIATLRARPDVGAVSPRLVYPDGAHQATGWHLPTVRRLAGDLLLRRPREVAPDPRGATRVGWLMGCFVMTTRATLLALDGWDTGFWFHGTDLEFCARVGARGLDVLRLEGHDIVHVGHRAWDPERRRLVRRAQQLWLLRDHGPAAAAVYGIFAGARAGLRR